MKELIYIFIGSGLGGITRFSLGKWVNTFYTNSFPYGTLIINILACLVLGCIVGMAENKQLISPQLRLFVVVGFCGGFSTFSTFTHETLMLIQGNNFLTSILYVLLSVVLCLSATYLGLFLGNKI